MKLHVDEYCPRVTYSMSERERDETIMQTEEGLTLKHKGHDYLNTHNDFNLHMLSLAGVANNKIDYIVASRNRLNAFT